MFGARELILLVAVAAAFWFVQRWANNRHKDTLDVASRRRRYKRGEKVTAQDLEACPACGDYAVPGAKSCGRADCPR